jgi:hypothetical protein
VSANKQEPAEVAVTNLGPVAKFSFTTPVPGGVVVLEGGQGAGKSTVIRGVSRLLGGKTAELSALDGAPRGSIAINEAILRVTRAQSRVTGEDQLEVIGLEGRLSIDKLVDPGIQNLESADAERLRALVSLSGVVAKPEMFYEICGGEEAYKALAVDDKTDDLILLSSRVKKALESQARAAEGLAEKARAEYQATRATFEDLDMDGPHDAAALSVAQEEAAAALASMKAHNEAAGIARRAVETSTRKLQELGEASESAEQLANDQRRCEGNAKAEDQKAEDQGREIADIREKLAAAVQLQATARQRAAEWREKAREFGERADAAADQAERRRVLAEDAARSVPTPFTEDELADAAEAVQEARRASERGAVIRRAR